ncbi:hypothetical protein I3760_09G214200 [Carya illinoinensis]|nr:hypothetical protein I3760_09G214200 [Carya illinoinensis]
MLGPMHGIKISLLWTNHYIRLECPPSHYTHAQPPNLLPYSSSIKPRTPTLSKPQHSTLYSHDGARPQNLRRTNVDPLSRNGWNPQNSSNLLPMPSETQRPPHTSQVLKNVKAGAF